MYPSRFTLSLENARRLVARFVAHYNTVLLHSAIGYVTPQDMLLKYTVSELRLRIPQL